MTKYTVSQLAERVHDYLQRGASDKKVEILPFEKMGTFQIFSGALNARGKREAITPLYHGRFLDVVTFAVQHKDFVTDYCQGPGDFRAGYVASWEQPEAHAPEGRPAGLDKLLKKLENAGSKKKRK